MIRTLKVLFCENEHGTGDVTFPDSSEIDAYSILQSSERMTVAQLRRDAKKAGWKRIQKSDYCPTCAESIEGDK